MALRLTPHRSVARVLTPSDPLGHLPRGAGEEGDRIRGLRPHLLR